MLVGARRELFRGRVHVATKQNATQHTEVIVCRAHVCLSFLLHSAALCTAPAGACVVRVATNETEKRTVLYKPCSPDAVLWNFLVRRETTDGGTILEVSQDR